MKLLFVFPILLSLLIPYQAANSNGESSPLTVVNFKWSKTRRTTETELFLFLTPRVLYTDEDVDSATAGVRPPPSARR